MNATQTLVVCHHLLLVYDASKFSTVCVVKLPVVGLLLALENLVLTPSVLVLYGLVYMTFLRSTLDSVNKASW